MSVLSRRSVSAKSGGASFARSLRVGASVASLIAAGVGLSANAATIDLMGVNTTFPGITSDTYINTGGAADLIIDLAGAASLTGTIDGSFGPIRVQKIGAGAQTFSTANTYTLGTLLQVGTLRYGVDGAFGSGSITFTGAGAILQNYVAGTNLTNNVALMTAGTFDSGGVNGTISGVVSGAGTLSKTGNGALILTGNNTFTGGVTLTNGSLLAGSNTAFGTNDVTTGANNVNIGTSSATTSVSLTNNFVISTAGRRLFVDLPDAAHTLTLTGNVSGAGGLYLSTGEGTLILSNATTYTGTTLMASGFLGVGNGGSIGGGASTIFAGTAAPGTPETGIRAYNSVTLNNTIRTASSVLFDFDTNGYNLTQAGVVRDNSSAGSIQKLGAGRLTLSAANIYTGTTTVSAGELAVTGSIDPMSAVSVASGATLSGTGSLFGTTTVANGGIVSPGVAGVGTLTFNNLVLNNASLLNFNLDMPNMGGGMGNNDYIVVSNNLTLDGILNVTAGGGFANGTYHLANYQGALTDNGLAIGTLPGGHSYGIAINGMFVDLNVNALATTLYWDGAGMIGNGVVNGGPGTWNAVNTNWTDVTGANNQVWASDVGVFGTTGGTVTVSGIQTFNTLQFSVNGYTLTGGALSGNAMSTLLVDPGVTARIDSAVGGGATLTKTGTGTLILTNSNGFTGFVIGAGTLAAGNDLALGGTGIAISNGATLQAFGGTRTLANNLALTGVGIVDAAGQTLNLNGVISGASALTVLDSVGGGKVVLGGVNTYTNGTSIFGTAQISNNNNLGAAASNLSLSNGTLITTANLTNARAVSLNSVYGRLNPNVGTTATFNGVISGAQLQANGAGTLVLGNAGNTYSGGTSIGGGGTVSIANDGALGTAGLSFDAAPGTLVTTAGITSTRNVTFNAGGTIDTQANNDSFSGTFSGMGGLTKLGAGQLTLTGTNTYLGGTNLNAGSIRVAAGNNLGTGLLTTTGGTTLVAGTATSQTFTIANNIALGVGTTTLDLVGTNPISVDPNTLIQTTDGTNLTLSGQITGAGGLTFNPATVGNLYVTGASNTYSGGTYIQGSTVAISNGNALGTGTISFNGGLLANNSGGSLTVANAINFPFSGGIGGTSDIVLSGVISGAGGFFKDGPDKVTVTNANNTYSGVVLLTGGNLQVDGGFTNAGLTLFALPGTTLSGTGTIAGSITSTGGTLAPGDSPGTLTVGNLTLDGASTLAYEYGAANVVGGALNDLTNVTGNLTLDGTINVTTSAGGTFGPGFYRIASYGGTITDNILNVGALPNGTATVQVNTVAKKVNLIHSNGVGSLAQYWDGTDQVGNGTVDGGNGIWNSALFNWTDSSGLFNATWQGDIAYFAGTAGTVQLTAAENFSSLVFLTSGYTLVDGGGGSLVTSGTNGVDAGMGITTTITTNVTGTGTINKTGAGTLILSGANTYSGGTTLTGGRIGVGSNTALGNVAGPLTMSNGTELFANGGTFSVGNGIVLNGTDNFNSNGNALVLDGVVSGTGTLNKTGTGTLVLVNAGNTYSGGTQINLGALQIASDGALGNTSGGITFTGTSALRTTSSVTSTRNIVLNTGVVGAIDTQGNDDTFSGVISSQSMGSGVLSKAGSGRLTLSGNNTYSGGTTLTDGTLRVTNNNSIGTGSLVTTNGTTLQAGIGLNQTITLANAISLGAGTTTIDFVGTLANYSNVTGAVSTNGTTLSLNGVISGAGGLTTTQGGAWNVNGNNTYAGGTTLNGIVAVIGNANALGTGAVLMNSNSGIINNSGSAFTLGNAIQSAGALENVLGGSSNLTLTGVLSGTGSVAKAGTDRLTLTNAANTFSGTINANNGELRVDGALTSGAGIVNVNIGSTLSGVGSIAGTVNVADFGSVSPGDSPGTLTVGNLNLSNASILNFELGQANMIAGAFNDRIVVTNNLVLDGNLIVTQSAGGTFGLGIYNLFSYNTVTDNTLNISALPPGFNGFVQNQVAAKQINLIITTPGTFIQYWDGADVVGNGTIDGGNGTWNAALTNWTGPAPSALNTSWVPTSVAVFQGAAGTVGVSGTQSFQGLIFQTGGYTLNGAGSLSMAAGGYISVDPALVDTINTTITGTGPLSKQGAGELVLGGTNTYTGITNLDAGNLTVTSNGALSGGQLAMNGANTVLAAGTNGLNLANAIALNNTGNAIDSRGNTFTLSGVVSGTGALNKFGTGTLVLNNANTYGGATNLNVGVIQVGNNAALSGGVLNMADNTVLQSGAAGLNIANAIVLGGFDTVRTNGNTLTLSGVISGSGSLSKQSAGELDLTAANTYTGGTFLVAGTIGIGNNTALGTNTLTMNGGTTLRAIAAGLSVANAINIGGNSTVDTNGNDLTLGGAINGGGLLNKIGTGNLILNGANGYIGGTNLALGTITVGTSTALGTNTLTMNNGTTLAAGVSGLSLLNNISANGVDTVDSGPGVFTLGGVISGPGSITKVNSGNLVLNGANSYAGGTALNAGTITVGTNTALGGGTLAMAGGTTLAAGVSGLSVGNAITTAGVGTVDSGPGVFTLGGTISGAGSITKVNSGNLVLNGANSYNGLVISSGTTTLGTNTAGGAGSITIGGGTTLAAGVSGLVVNNAVTTLASGTVNSGPGVFTLTGVVSGAGSITKTGAGNLVLANANTFTDLGVSTGTVTLGTNTAAGIGGISLAGGTTLAAGVSGLVVNNATSTAGVGTVDSGPGTFTLSNTVFGPGSITKTGAGNLTLGGNNTFTNLAISNGTVTLNTNTAAGVGNIAMANGTALRAGVDALTVGNAVALTGGDTIDTQAFTLTMSGPFTGTGGLNKVGIGTLVMTGASTYTGPTSVSFGTLKVNGSLGNTAVDVLSGATLAGTGSIAGAVTIENGGNLNPGNSPGTLTVGSLVLNAASNVNYELGAPNTIGGVLNDLTIVTGNLTLDGLLNVTNPPGGSFGLGIYELFQYGGALTDNTLSINSLPGGANGLVQTIVPGQVNLVITAPGTLMLYWDGADGVGNGVISGGSGTWDAGTPNWTGAPPSALDTNWQPNSIAVFQTTPGNVTVTGNQMFTGLQFATTNYVLGGGGSLVTNPAGAFIFTSTGVFSTINTAISGTGGIAKQGGGTLLLAGNNGGYSGNTDLQAGILQVGSSNALGVGGTLTMQNATTLESVVNGLTIANAIVTVGADTVNTNANTFTLSGNISGAGSITKTGSGNLILNGNNSFIDLGIAAGTVTLGTNTAGGSGGISIGNGTTLAAGVSGLVVNNAISTAGAGTVNSGPGIFTLSNTIFGPGSITKTGSGNLVLTGNNLFTDLGIQAGRVTLGTNTAAGIGGISIGNGTTLASGAAGLVIGNAISTQGAGTVDTAANTFTLSNTIFGPGSITKIGSGNLVLNGNNLFQDLGIQAGRVTLGTNTAAGVGGISMNGGTTLAAGTAGLVVTNNISTAGAGTIDTNVWTFTLNGQIAGPGSITKIGSGNLVLNGNNSFQDLGIQAGRVTLGTNTAAGVGGISMAGGTTLAAGTAGLVVTNNISTAGAGTIDTNVWTFTLNGQIAGPGSITKIGSGNLVLNGNNSFQDLGIQAGRVTLGTNTAAGVGGISMAGGTTLASGAAGLVVTNNISTAGAGTVDTAANTFTLSGQIAGPGSITKIGSGNLVLNGNNSFQDLGIQAGRVTLGTNTAAGVGGISMNGGTTLAAGTAGLVVTNNISTAGAGTVDTNVWTFTLNGQIAGPGSITKIGSGNLVLNGNNSYTNLGIFAGTVTLGTNTAAGNGGISMAGGTTLAAGVSGLVVANAISTAGAGTVNSGPGIFTLTGPIAGPGSITKTGSGNLVLNGNNSFTDLGIQSGRVTVGTNTAAGIGGISMAGGTTLAAGGPGLTLANAISTAGAGTIDTNVWTFTLNGPIAGPGSITKIGTGNLVLNGNNSFTDLGIFAGRVTLGTNTAAGIGGISMAGGTTLASGTTITIGNAISTAGAGTIDTGANTFTISNTVSGPGSITKTGSGNLVLNGANTFTDLGIQAGRVTLGTNTAAGNGGISMAGGTTLAAGTAGLVIANPISTAGAGTIDTNVWTFTLNGSVAGPGSITKIGSGNLILNAANTFTDLGIQAGRVTLGTNTSAGIGGISMAGGTTLAAGVSGLVVANAISTAGAGTIDSGSGVFTLSGPIAGPGSITKISSGNLVLNGNNSFTDLGIQAGTVTLGTNTAAGNGGISMAGGTTLAAGVSGLVVANAVSTAGAGTVDSGSGVFTLSGPIAGPGSITKIGSGNLVLNGNNSFTDLGIFAGRVTVGTNTAAGNGGISMAGGTTLAAGTAGLTLANTISTAGAGTVDTGVWTFTLNGAIAGPGSITKIGTGNLVLNGNNSFTDLGIFGGTVTLGSNTAAGNGGISMAGGTTLAAGTTITIGNTISTAGAGTIDSGSGTFTISNAIAGPGSITKIGSGNLVLNGANTYVDLGVFAGRVTLGTNTAGGVGGISLGGGTTLAAGTAGLVIGNAISTAGAGTIDTGVWNFTLSNSIAGPGSITKIGSGNLILNGNNSFTNLGVFAGTVTLGTNTAAGNGGISLAGGTTLAAGVSGLTIGNAISTAAAGTIDSGSGVFTVSNTILGPGSITKIGSGNLVLNGANSFTDLGVQAGRVTLGTNTAAGNGGISLGGGTTLAAGVSGLTVGNAVSTAGAGTIDSGSGVFTLSNTILGPGSITKIGSGNLVLNGANSFTNLGIFAGTVTLGTNTSAGGAASGISLGNGATLAAGAAGLVLANPLSTAGAGTIDTGAFTFTLNGQVSGPGSITKIGSGNLVLNGANTFTNLGVFAGTVTLGTSTAAGAAPGSGISLGNGATLAAGVDGLNIANPVSLTGSTTVDTKTFGTTLSGGIIGTGGLTKVGTGVLNLTGASTYTGATSVGAGRLNVTGSIGSSATTVQSGAVLTGTGTVGALTVASGGTASPGAGVGSIGTLLVNGGVTFAAGSTFAVDIGATTADRITASGPASLNGTLALSVMPGTFGFNQTFTVLSSSARTGTFAATTGANFGVAFNPTVTYDATSVFVKLNPASLVTLGGGTALTANQAQVAGAFDRATAAGFNPQGFFSLYNSGAAIPGFLNQLSGELHSAERRVALEDTRVVREAAFDRLNAGTAHDAGTQTATTTSGDAETVIWLRGAGSWGKADGDGNGSSFETKQAGVLTGVDYSTGDWKVGAAFNYTRTDLDYTTLGNSKVTSTGGTIYGGYRQDNGFAAGVGGSIASVSAKGNRAITATGLGQTLTAKDDGTSYQLFGELAYDLSASASSRIEPFARFAYAHLKVDAFSETGGNAAVSGVKQDYHFDVTTVGLRGSTDVGMATLSGSVGYQHIGGDRSPTALLSIAGLNQTQAINAVALDKNAAAIEAQASFRVGSSATLGIGYSGVIGSKNHDHGARATLTVGF